MLWFPLLFITTKHKLNAKEINTLLWVFTLSVFAASIACTMVWLGYTKHKVIDIRDISIFHSHIRFALMIDLAVCFLIYDFFKTKKNFFYILKFLLSIWLMVFLGIMQSFTGIVLLVFIVSYIVYLSITSSQKIKLNSVAITSFVIIGVVFCAYLIQVIYAQLLPVKPTNQVYLRSLVITLLIPVIINPPIVTSSKKVEFTPKQAPLLIIVDL